MKIYCILMMILTSSIFCFAQKDGLLIKHLTFKSEVLKDKCEYSVYLPVGYKNNKQKYPVLYLLNALTRDSERGVDSKKIEKYIHKIVRSKMFSPMIVIIPVPKQFAYTNDYQNKIRYEDYLVDELIPYVDKKYRTKVQKEYRALAGISFGGYAALLIALKHLNLFISCATLVPEIYLDEEIVKMKPDLYANLFSNLYCEQNKLANDRLTSHWYNSSIVEIVKNTADSQLNLLQFYLEYSQLGSTFKGSNALHLTLEAKQIQHENKVRERIENAKDWQAGTENMFKFVSDCFKNVNLK